MKGIITIKVSNYFTNELVTKISKAQWNSTAPAWVNRIRQSIFDDKMTGDCFGVVAMTASGEVIGRLHCIRSDEDPQLWYYGDLFVIASFRRRGIATQMVGAAVMHLSDMGVRVLRCYVVPNNLPSIQLQRSMGFREKAYKSFNDLSTEGQLMFEYDLPNQLCMIPATAEEAYFVRMMFIDNQKYLHCQNISLQEWRELLAADDPDERHFLICKGAMPVGYMKINGLLNGDTAWLSTLFISEKYQRQGIGTYAVRYAEEFAVAMGFFTLCIQTTDDNTAAKKLYEACGYTGYFQPQNKKWCFQKGLK